MKKNMKATGLLFTMILATASMSSNAFADRCWHGGCGGDGGLSAFLVTLDLYSLTTTAAAPDERAVYVQQIHEDAAAYLADGTETAILDEAMENTEAALQAQGKTATDTQIATALLTLQ